MGLDVRNRSSGGLANNKGVDQLAHLHSLINAFVIHFLESTISKLVSSKIALFYLVSVAEQAGFGNHEDRFSRIIHFTQIFSI